MSGSLTVVGTGIRAITQVTPEAGAAIRTSDVVYYVVPDVVSAQLLHAWAKEAHDLADLYAADRDRIDTYAAMVDRIVKEVSAGREVCAVFYGHPGAFVDPSHAAIGAVRATGLPARMLPGVSAADALYADLSLDPGTEGIAQYTATDFILRPRLIDPTTPLLLWQIGAVGEQKGATQPATEHLDLVVDRLEHFFPPNHLVVLYVAAAGPTGEAKIDIVPLANLADAPIARESTLLVPGLARARVDQTVAERLGLEDATQPVAGRVDIELLIGSNPGLVADQIEQLGVSLQEAGG